MPPMETARLDLKVVWLPDGRIFAIGGRDVNDLNSVEKLSRGWAFNNETADQWSRCSSMLNARSAFSAVVLPDVTVLVAEGCGWELTKNVELFIPPAPDDPQALGQWTQIQPMQSTPSSRSTGVHLEGIVFVFGKLSQLSQNNAQRKSSKLSNEISCDICFFSNRRTIFQNPTILSFRDRCQREFLFFSCEYLHFFLFLLQHMASIDFTDWVWDEHLSLTTVFEEIRSTRFK